MTPFNPIRSRLLLLLPIAAASLAGLSASPASAQSSGTAAADSYFTAGGATTNNTYLDLEGPGTGTFAEFGVIDFSTSALDPTFQTATAIQNNQLTLSLTESNASFTAPATLEFYLTTATGVSIATGSTLRYQTANGTSSGPNPYGIAPTLGSIGGTGNSALFDLGTGAFTTTGNTKTGQVDTYTLTLGSAAAQSAFLSELNTVGGNVRLVAVVNGTQPNGAGTFYGAGNSTTTNRPTLSFNGTFATSNALYWQGGNNGSWVPSGGTNFSSSASTPGNTGWINDGTATAIFANTANLVNVNAGNVNAAGLEFDVNGYVINASGAGSGITLTGNAHTVNVVNATDTATINAPLAGTVGLNKVGAGTLAIGASTVNTFSGGVNVIAGSLQISADANLGAAANGITLGGTGALNTVGSLTLGAAGTTGRVLSGSGTLGVTAGNTLTLNGVVNAGGITLSGAGTVALANTAAFDAGNGPSNSLSNVTFGAAGTTVTAPGETNLGNNLGDLTLGGASVPSSVTGAATINANVNLVASTTSTFTVSNAGSTLTINGDLTGSGKITKLGSGTLVLGGTGASGLTAPSGTLQQGSAGTTPTDGGIISVSNVAAMPTGQYQANAGTVRNDSGGALTFANTISLGAQNAATSPGGLVLADKNGAGTAAITLTGAISLYQAGTTAYTRYMTVNTPTTLSGGLTQSGTTGTGGLTFGGTSTLMLNAATPNTLTVPITIANTGGTTAATTGTFAATPSLTIAINSRLTINTGVTGTVDTINDNGLVTLNGTSGTPASFGKIVLTLANSKETVGGLMLSAADTFTLAAGGTTTLQPGLAPAGTYGAVGSGATYQSNDYFGGLGTLNNTAAVPEPGTWTSILLGFVALVFVLRAKSIVAKHS